MAAPEIVLVSATSERADIVRMLHAVNDKAKACKPSPRWADLHGALDELLGWLGL